MKSHTGIYTGTVYSYTHIIYGDSILNSTELSILSPYMI